VEKANLFSYISILIAPTICIFPLAVQVQQTLNCVFFNVNFHF